MKTALIPCTSTSGGLNGLSFSTGSQWKDLKCFHVSSIGNCLFENANFFVKFGAKPCVGRNTLFSCFYNMEINLT